MAADQELKKSFGTVKWFSGQKGFGFIAPDEGGDDLFVHQTEIQAEGFRFLRDGQRVEFHVDTGEDGRCKAVDVVKLARTPRFGNGHGGGGGRGRGRRGGFGRYGGGGGRRGGGGVGGGGGGGGMECYNCGRVGHLARECDGGQNVEYRGDRGGGGRNRGVRGARGSGIHSGGGRYGSGRGGGGRSCYDCGEEGHFARDCRNGQN